MGESDGAASKAIPSWQLPSISHASDSSKVQTDRSTEDARPDPRLSLIEKASRFLDDEEIREASKERKVYFLRTKGLTDQEIEDLLAKKDGIIRSEQETSAEDETHASTEPIDATAPAEGVDVDMTDDYMDSDPSPSSPSHRQEGPPIITYPEFLLHSQKPPPLITTGRLLTALYLTSGAAATMYGLSNYLIEPMVETLSAARHSFFQNAATNVDKLNEKLESTVSRIPDTVHGYDGLDESDADDDADASSDPARFFSRTVATQTSPHLSQSSSSTSLPEKAPSSSPSAVVASQAAHLSRLHDMLSDMKDADEEGISDPVRDNVRALREYLDNLPSLGRTGSTGGERGGGGSAPMRKNEDGVAKVKAEIKSVKGTLLSARNFPAGITSR